MEVQNRGSPHIHMVLYTGKSAEEYLQIEDLVVARTPDVSIHPQLAQLVAQKQSHRYGYVLFSF